MSTNEETTDYDYINDGIVSQQQNIQNRNTNATLNKPGQLSRLNLIIVLIITTCIALAAIGCVIHLYIEKQDVDTRLNTVVTKLNIIEEQLLQQGSYFNFNTLLQLG